jgi:hypothetical protein
MASERQLASARYQYGCTPDIWGQVNGQRAVIELKSTAAIHPSVGLQTAAQEQAITEMNCWPPGTAGPVSRYALQLAPSGKYRIHHFDNRGDLAVFIALRSVYGWRASHNLGDFKHGN